MNAKTRCLNKIREDMRNYLEMAALFRAVGELRHAAEYERYAEAMKREMELIRTPERIQS